MALDPEAVPEASCDVESVGICDLPADLVFDIMALADTRGACALASACRRMREMTSAPRSEWAWRAVARATGAWRCMDIDRYDVLDGEEDKKYRMPERWRALVGRGNHRSYTEAVEVHLPASLVLGAYDADGAFSETLTLAGRPFVLRVYRAKPHEEEEDATTLHSSYGVGITVELEMVGETNGADAENPLTAHLVFQIIPVRGGGTTQTSPVPLDPLTGATRVLGFHRFVKNDSGDEKFRASRCIPINALVSNERRFEHEQVTGEKTNTKTNNTFVLRIGALLHEDEHASSTVPGWRRAGKPRGPADVLGARLPLLERLLGSPERATRALAVEFYLLWISNEGIDVRWRRHERAWYGRLGCGRIGASTNTARLFSGGGAADAGWRAGVNERAPHNVARLTPVLLKLAMLDSSPEVARIAATALATHVDASEANAGAFVRHVMQHGNGDLIRGDACDGVETMRSKLVGARDIGARQELLAIITSPMVREAAEKESRANAG
jgi:hypothetical protein